MRPLIVLLALLTTGCYYEQRGPEVWVCGAVQTSAGPLTSCQDTGLRVSQ